MKKIFFIALLVLLGSHSYAQHYMKQFDVALPDSIQSTQAHWVDIDNDGLLDVLLFSTAQSGKSYFQYVKGDTTATPVLHPGHKPVIQMTSFLLTDYDRDNKIDVLVSGERNGSPLTNVYINKGNFEFEERQVSTETHQAMAYSDLDNDAHPEWLVSGEDNGGFYLRMLKRESALVWKTVHDTLKIRATALEIVDANGDGNFDVFVSGTVAPDSLVTVFLINNNNLFFKPYLAEGRSGITTAGDVNFDGTFDLLLAGKEKNNTLSTHLYESSDGVYVIKTDPVTLNETRLFMADLNSDGIPDVNYTGRTLSNDTLNTIRYGANEETLNSRDLVQQSFGDAEHDGDLDLIQVISEDVLRLAFYENQPAAENLKPGPPKRAIAVNVFNRLFMYWDKPTDDHTAVQSLTFDLHLNGHFDYQAGNFDMENERRLFPTHGNNWTQNFRLLKRMSAANLTFAIQAVDNSLHSSVPCVGSGLNCINAEAETLSVCSNEALTLSSPPDALWFSFSEGFLGISDGLTLTAEKSDTVFYYNPATSGCGGLKVWAISMNDDTLKTEVTDRYACQGSDIQFTAEAGWNNITWSSQLKGDLGTANSITYNVSQPDSVMLTMSNDAGCTIIRKTAVKISKPVLQLNGDNFKILKGSEIQLIATGAATYIWTPSTGLSQANIPNPMASPATTIQYTVTGYDSLGCTDVASVNIIVEGAGFIPNLFTPNDDGKNDALKVYGLPSVKDFNFTIHNREGSLVFKTTDVNEAVQRGWDGTRNGVKQPAGVYFWKVKGEVPSGDRVLLNGKDSGSIVLVR